MTTQPSQPQGPKGPEHGPHPAGEGHEISADDQRFMDDLNSGRDQTVPDPLAVPVERAGEKPNEGDEFDPSIFDEPELGADGEPNREQSEPSAAATGGEEPKPADDDDTAERPVAGGGDDDEEPPKRGWFGRVKDRISDAYYKAGAAATVGGGERGDRIRRNAKFLPVGVAAVGAAGIVFAGASLLDGGDSHSFNFVGGEEDFKSHLGVNGEDQIHSSVAENTSSVDPETGDPGVSADTAPGTESKPDKAADSQPLDHFEVESGNGISHEIQDYAKNHGIDLSDDKSYALYEQLHKKFPDQDIISLLDHNGADSYNYTDSGTGISEQRISAPSGNATFGSQDMQDFVDQKLGIGSEGVAPAEPVSPSDKDNSGIEYELASDAYQIDQDKELSSTIGPDIEKDVESHSEGPMISSETHSSSLSTGEKLLMAGAAGLAVGGAAHLYMNRNRSQNESTEGTSSGGNDGEASENSNKEQETSNSRLEERIAALEQALIQQKEAYEKHILELTNNINSLQEQLVEAVRAREEAEQKNKDQEDKEQEEREREVNEKAEKYRKKAKKAKKKTKKAKKKASKEKTKRKVTKATLHAERKAHSDIQLAEARARFTEEMRSTAERERTRADLLTKA